MKINYFAFIVFTVINILCFLHFSLMNYDSITFDQNVLVKIKECFSKCLPLMHR